jgi:hypothetical protein
LNNYPAVDRRRRTSLFSGSAGLSHFETEIAKWLIDELPPAEKNFSGE